MPRRATRQLLGWLTGFARREAALLVALLLVVAGLWAFLEILDEVRENETEAVDARIMGWVHASNGDPAGPPWLVTAALDVTALGSAAVLTLVVALVAGYLLLLRDRLHAVLVVVAAGLGSILASVLKAAVGRPRPDEALHLAEVSSASFPSGHSMLSATVYLTLGAILVTTRPRRREKAYILGAAALLTFLVGLTRVYLGVHYPTDVLAGWSVGLCWALLGLIAARTLQRGLPGRRAGAP